MLTENLNTAAVAIAPPSFNRSGDVVNPTHAPVSASSTVARLAQTEADYYARASQPRLFRRGWLLMDDDRRLAHLERCADTCDRCRPYRQGRTVNTQCGECEYVGDMPIVSEPDGQVEVRCPACLSSAYVRVED